MAGNSNPALADGISDVLNKKLVEARIVRFNDEEIFVEVKQNVRGDEIFVIQSTSYPANDHLMELLITIDALRRASSSRITAVIPYFGYARQDRKTAPRTPISAKLVADLITTAGADRVVTVDLHAAQIQGFFNIPTDNLYAAPVFARDILKNFENDDSLLVVSPDVGGVVRARNLANRLGTTIAIADKRRSAPGQSEVMNIIGDVKGKRCILIDDIIDSGGTLCNAAEALMNAGALEVSAYVTHGILSGKAPEKIGNSSLKELVITDTIAPRQDILDTKNIRILSMAPLLGEAIRRIAQGESVSTLFD